MEYIMKLRNKKTGEIVELLAKPSFVKRNDDFLQSEVNTFNSLAELNEELEDYEEPKDYWFIDYDGGIIPFSKMKDTPTDKLMKQIGNYFDTREEAEAAVEKLKAWKLLTDMGFEIEGIRYKNNRNYIEWSINQKGIDSHFNAEAFNDALHLLFGDEE